MSAFKQIQQNLHGFIRKYFLNELFKGIILFVVFGFLYVLITALIEYFFWLPTSGRKYLFYAQWLVLGIFFIFFILKPLLNLFGIQKKLTEEKAARIVGRFFPDIKDKLLNTLQLHKQADQSDLIWASIEQKSEMLNQYQFSKAVDFKRNFKFLPLLLVPFLILLILRLSHFDTQLSKGYQRVLSYDQSFTPPLPYTIHIQDSLQVLKGNDFRLFVHLKGQELPRQLYIHLDKSQHLLKKESDSLFSFYFPLVQKPLDFQLSDGKHDLGTYQLNIIYPPVIQSVKVKIFYPAYLHKKPKIYSFMGNLTLPESATIQWDLRTNHVDTIYFVVNDRPEAFAVTDNRFRFKKRAEQDFTYRIDARNIFMKHSKEGAFKVSIIKDELPKISVLERKDSINLQNYHHITASDDYAVSKLQLVYTNQNSGISKQLNLSISPSGFIRKTFIFPGELPLHPGDSYAYYFQVFDNDAVHHYKSVKSKTFHYNKLTFNQQKDQLMNQQQQSLNQLDKIQNQFTKQQQQFTKLQQKIAAQKSMDWHSKKQLEKSLQQAEQQEQFFKQAVKKYKDLLNKFPHEKDDIQKQELQKRLDELAKMDKKKKLLDELKKLAEKLKKEDLVKKLKDLDKYSEHQEKSLERILELTKKYYMQQKMQKIANQLDSLSKQQEKLAQKNTDTQQQQDSLNQQLAALKKQTDSLQQLDKTLKKPMHLPDHSTEMEEIQMDMQQASQKLQQQAAQQANNKQQKAANKMKQLSKQMQMSMQGSGGEQKEEDIKTLQALLKSLLNFSFKEESLLTDLFSHQGKKALSQQLLTQNNLKKYFVHINDSLYTLALRNPKISQKILDEAFEIDQNLDKSLSYLSENQSFNTQNAAQYVLKGANSLADMLSNALDNMKNASPSSGKGQGKKGKGKSFSLPDIIKKQGDAIAKMQQGLKNKGKKPGSKKGDKPGKDKKGNKQGQTGSDGEAQRQYELYKQQQRVKEDLQQLGDRFSDQATKHKIKQLTKQMDQLQKRLLQEGITQSTLNKMIQLQHELLKLKNATFTQHQDEKRESRTNFNSFKGLDSIFMFENKNFDSENERIKRTQIPVNQKVKKKIIQYLN